MFEVKLSRQIYDDPEDREEKIIYCDTIVDCGECVLLNVYGGSLLYDIDIKVNPDHIDSITRINEDRKNVLYQYHKVKNHHIHSIKHIHHNLQ